MKTLHVALAGNPNCGKTTVFNALTGSRKRVGNWPGVTVERMVGEYDHCGATIEVTDLPGIYFFSIIADEIVAREHILFDKPDVVVNVIDASKFGAESVSHHPIVGDGCAGGGGTQYDGYGESEH